MEGITRTTVQVLTPKVSPTSSPAESKGITVAENVPGEIYKMAQTLSNNPSLIASLATRLAISARLTIMEKKETPVLKTFLSPRKCRSLKQDEIAEALTKLIDKIPEESRIQKLNEIAEEIVSAKSRSEPSSSKAGTKRKLEERDDSEEEKESKKKREEELHAQTGLSTREIISTRIQINSNQADNLIRAGIPVHRDNQTGECYQDLRSKVDGRLIQDDMVTKDPEIIAMEAALNAIAELKPFGNNFNQCCILFTFEGYEATRTLSIYRRMNQTAYNVHIDKPEMLSKEVTETVIEVHFKGRKTLNALMEGKFNFRQAFEHNLITCNHHTEMTQEQWREICREIAEVFRDRGTQIQDMVRNNSGKSSYFDRP